MGVTPNRRQYQDAPVRRRWSRLPLLLAVLLLAAPALAADFGDAPDIHQVDPKSSCGFPTLSVSGGAQHIDTSWAWLGRSVTDEGDARVTDRDQDDGLLGRNTVKVHNQKWEGPLYLNVLFDTSAEGEADCKEPYGLWQDASEWVVQNREVRVAPGKEIEVGIPAVPDDTWVRITLTGSPVNGYTGRGIFGIGETEDYYFHGAGKPVKAKLPPPPHEPPTIIEEPPEGPGPTGGGTDNGGGDDGEDSGKKEGGEGAGGQPHGIRRPTGYRCWYPPHGGGGGCQDCITRNFKRCIEGSPEFSRLCSEAKDARSMELNAIDKANATFGRWSQARGKSKDKEALAGDWKTDFDAYRKARDKFRKADKAVKSALARLRPRCRMEAESACYEQCTTGSEPQPVPRDLRPHCNPLTPPASEVPPLVSPVVFMKRHKHLSGFDSKGFLLDVGRNRLNPQRLLRSSGYRARAEQLSVRHREISHDTGLTFQTVRISGKPYRVRKKIGPKQCRLTEVQEYKVTTYRIYVRGDVITFDWWYSFVDAEAAAIKALKLFLAPLPASKLIGYAQALALAIDGDWKGLTNEFANIIVGRVANFALGGILESAGAGYVGENLARDAAKLGAGYYRELLLTAGIGELTLLKDGAPRVSIDPATPNEAGFKQLSQALQAEIRETIKALSARYQKVGSSVEASKGSVNNSIHISGRVFVPTELCVKVDDISIQKRTRDLGTVRCGDLTTPPETTGRGEPEVVIIRPPDNISGFNPLDENDIREQIGGEEGASGTAVAVGGGGAPAGGGGGGGNPADFIPNGSYTGNNGCGLGSIVVNSNSSTRFVAQVPGNGTVEFIGTGTACPHCQYSASGLTLFGVGGHLAIVTLTPPNQFSFQGSRPGASCSELFGP